MLLVTYVTDVIYLFLLLLTLNEFVCVSFSFRHRAILASTVLEARLPLLLLDFSGYIKEFYRFCDLLDSASRVRGRGQGRGPFLADRQLSQSYLRRYFVDELPTTGQIGVFIFRMIIYLV